MDRFNFKLEVVDENPEVWVNVGEVLEWLDDLANQTPSFAGASAALEIRQMLFEIVSDSFDHPVVAKS